MDSIFPEMGWLRDKLRLRRRCWKVRTFQSDHVEIRTNFHVKQSNGEDRAANASDGY